MVAALDYREEPVASRPTLAAAAPAPDATGLDPELDAEQERAERSFWHDATVGAVIGIFVCSGLWMVIVAVALVGAGWSLGGPLAMAAGVGVFAGAFLGGWAGVMVGAARLEAAEHQIAKQRAGHRA